MTHKQEVKVRKNAYKYFDEVIYENQDWDKCDIAISSFCAGAEYALKNKYDELKHDVEEKNDKPNIVQFLKDNGVYDMFFANLLNNKQGEDLNFYFFSHFSTVSAIMAAFTWTETPEGYRFWEVISDRWGNQF